MARCGRRIETRLRQQRSCRLFLQFARADCAARRFLRLKQSQRRRACVAQSSGHHVGQREVVAIVVGGGLELLRLFEIRQSFRNGSLADINFAEIVIRFVIIGIEFRGFCELFLRQFHFSQSSIVRREIGTCFDRAGIQSHGFGQVCVRFRVFGLRGVDQAKQLLHFKRFRHFFYELLERRHGFRVLSRFIERDRRAKQFVLVLRILTGRESGQPQEHGQRGYEHR